MFAIYLCEFLYHTAKDWRKLGKNDYLQLVRPTVCTAVMNTHRPYMINLIWGL